MTEITRVPLQPVRKGTLAKLWIGVAAAVLLAGGVAWAAMPETVQLSVQRDGEGASPTADDVVLVNYTGRLDDGTVFDEGQRTPMLVSQVIPGFAEGLMQMKKGGSYTLRIPADQAYGAEEKTNPETGETVIPANSDLIFDVEVLDFLPRAVLEQRVQAMRSMMGQGGPGGMGGMPVGPDGAPIAPPAAPMPQPGVEPAPGQ